MYSSPNATRLFPYFSWCRFLHCLIVNPLTYRQFRSQTKAISRNTPRKAIEPSLNKNGLRLAQVSWNMYQTRVDGDQKLSRAVQICRWHKRVRTDMERCRDNSEKLIGITVMQRRTYAKASGFTHYLYVHRSYIIRLCREWSIWVDCVYTQDVRLCRINLNWEYTDYLCPYLTYMISLWEIEQICVN